ncbi:MAG: YeeE/YedE family protein [Helicobacter sp.]|uniref:YeeE/YedE family protein n=1 Tax=Helicobacter sp. TaxID=218 RepID=UPI002A8147DC|nr:YeeE/YedE family protein [Helicobacter sp.]MDY4427315.1 YeeE/YedE family protein [Helicobacter sp.]MDY5615924.1 YeeE/YedE family protein [Helicobacter sp.]
MLNGIIVGLLLGFVLQRGRFCVVGAYRDVFLSKKFTIFIALFIVIVVQSIGVWALNSFGYISIKPQEFYWLSTIIGGVIFGFGMVIAGGCATGTWYRAGEGLIGSIVALFFYALSASIVKYGALLPLQNNLQAFKISDGTIYQSLGISPWILVITLGIIVSFFVFKELRKPRLKIARLKPKKTGISHLLFEKSWHPFITALLVALIAILAWPLSSLSGRNYGLGITTPSANLIQYLTTGNLDFIDWGAFFVLGIALGSFLAAKFSGEFKFRLPDKKTLAYSSIGGILMGIGASLAGGCTIGNGLVETALFSYKGWVATIFFLLGAYIATFFTIILPSRSVAQKS